ncbi:hypothetical protein GOV11_01440 [Candidatus Woesearchaeota archaeon]|nr:hypothetical protein [Candidatus Woesearchaeota archaeon]
MAFITPFVLASILSLPFTGGIEDTLNYSETVKPAHRIKNVDAIGETKGVYGMLLQSDKKYGLRSTLDVERGNIFTMLVISDPKTGEHTAYGLSPKGDSEEFRGYMQISKGKLIDEDSSCRTRDYYGLEGVDKSCKAGELANIKKNAMAAAEFLEKTICSERVLDPWDQDFRDAYCATFSD